MIPNDAINTNPEAVAKFIKSGVDINQKVLFNAFLYHSILFILMTFNFYLFNGVYFFLLTEN